MAKQVTLTPQEIKERREAIMRRLTKEERRLRDTYKPWIANTRVNELNPYLNQLFGKNRDDYLYYKHIVESKQSTVMEIENAKHQIQLINDAEAIKAYRKKPNFCIMTEETISDESIQRLAQYERNTSSSFLDNLIGGGVLLIAAGIVLIPIALVALVFTSCIGFGTGGFFAFLGFAFGMACLIFSLLTRR